MADVQLILGDCLDVLKTLESGSVDALITDPPYGIRHSSSYGASWQDTEIMGDSDTTVRDAALSILSDVPTAVFGTWKTKPIADIRGVLVWDKGPAFGMGDLSFPWKPSWELIYIRGEGWCGDRDEGVLRGHIVVSWESKGRVHPHQKPVSLISALLNKLPNVRTVVDPFMGSGSIGIACVQTGRKFIGIEIDPTYFAIAEKRIKAEQERFPLFDRMPESAQPSLFEA